MTRRGFKTKQEDTFSCELLKHLCCFNVTPNGWTKELNIVSWAGGRPVIDIRRWNADHTKMSKGITMTYEELIWLNEVLPEILQDEETIALIKSYRLYRDNLASVKFNMGRIRDITNEEEEEIKQAAKNAVREALANSKPNATSAQKEEQPTKEDNANNSEDFPF